MKIFLPKLSQCDIPLLMTKQIIILYGQKSFLTVSNLFFSKGSTCVMGNFWQNALDAPKHMDQFHSVLLLFPYSGHLS